MAKLERSKSSPAGELANERLIEAVFAPDRFPEGATFIGADEDHFPGVLAEAVAERRPLVIVYPDGRELVGEPGDDGLTFRNGMLAPAVRKLLIGLGHPVRLELLGVLRERTASTTELSKQLDIPLNNVSHHLRVLTENDFIELVRTEPRRGAVVHFYRAAATGIITDEDWRRLNEQVEQADDDAES
jgi:DNA-binding transcriptional ArsR family regulator